MRRFLSLLMLLLIVLSTPAFATQYINTANANTNLSIGNNNELFVDNVNDRIGIGTTSPSEKLSVEGSGTANENVARFNNQGDYASRIWLRNSGRSAYFSQAGSTADTIATGLLPGALSFGMSSGTSPIQFWNNNPATVKMTIATDGNVGIGDTTPTEGTLTVAGTGYFTGALTSTTLDTGQGANELYDMNQNVQTSDTVTFATLTSSGALFGQGGTYITALPWFNAASAPVGYVKLVTPIDHREGNMFNIHIVGYDYSSGGKGFDTNCYGYAYSGDTLISYGCQSTGNALYPIEIGTENRTGTTYVVIRIGTPSSTWYFQHFTAEYRGWNAKAASGFSWVTGETTPAQTGNTHNVVVNDNAGTVTATTFTGSLSGTATTATNIAGGNTGYIPFQSAASTTTFDGANLFWDNTNKRLGIGTSGPYTSLDVKRTNDIGFAGTGYRVATFTSTAAVNSDLPGVHLGYDSAGGGIIAPATQAGTTNFLAFWTYNGAWAEKVRIAKDGYVGIGTTGPQSKLHVQDGGIRIHSNGSDSITNGYYIANSVNNEAYNWQLLSNNNLALFTYSNSGSLGWGQRGPVIDKSGNVGIGTSGPGRKLEIADVANPVIRLTDTSAPTYYMEIHGGDTALKYPTITTANWDRFYLGAAGNDGVGIYSNRGLSVGTTYYATTPPANGVIIEGNIGIGTTSPTSALYVNSSSSNQPIAVFKQSHTSNDGHIVIDSPTNDQSRPVFINLKRAGTLQWSIGESYNGGDDFYFATTHLGTDATGSKMVIESTGNVGIGTTTPLSKLSINGGLHVGGDSDAGDNNALIDGTLTVTGTLDPNGAITLPTSGISGAGSGSGLDADKLDNLDSTQFLRSDTADNIGADLDLSAGAHIYRDDTSMVSVGTPMASYSSSSNALTGAIYFVLPAGFVASMMTLDFTGYTYDGNGAWKALVGGYAYSTSGVWINYNVQKYGSNRPTVRLGSRISDDHPVIIFGDDSTVWSYPKIALMQATFGHSGQTDYLGDWETGVTTTVASIFDGLVTPTDNSNVVYATNAGNAATATALAANGANCAAGTYPLGVDASGAVESCGSNINGNAGTASSVAWENVAAGTRQNYLLAFQPPASNFAGVEFKGTNSAGAGYFLIRGTSDSGVYTAEGITLVADQGAITLAGRTTTNGAGYLRFMTPDAAGTPIERMKIFATSGTVAVTNALTIGGTLGVDGAATFTSTISTGALTATTLDTGQGANELYDMNQNVQTSDAVTFANVISTGAVLSSPIFSQTEGIQDNLAPNPDFEFDAAGTWPPTGWTVEASGGGQVVDDSASISSGMLGRKAAYFPGDGAYRRLVSNYQIPLSAGQTIYGRVYLRGTAAGGGQLYFGMYWSDGSYTYFCANIDGGATYSRCASSLTVPAGVTWGKVWLFNYAGNTDPIYVRDVFVGNGGLDVVGDAWVGGNVRLGSNILEDSAGTTRMTTGTNVVVTVG